MRIQNIGPSVLVLVTLLAVMIVGPRLAQRIQHASQQAELRTVRADLNASDFLRQLSATFSGVAEAVRPSVVHVSTQSDSRGFFGAHHSAGSGWVYDAEGHIVTNHHVVAQAEKIHVRFADGAMYPARLIHSHEATDVAVLKVDGVLLHPAVRAPEPIRQGEVVFAFGSPFAEFDFSMSQGVVSATARAISLTPNTRFQNFIQTDAAINPGNSGGPLTNVYGEVVGMNTAILTSPFLDPREQEDSGTFLGLGFAVPVDMVSAVVDQIIETGEVKRAFLGIIFESRDPTRDYEDKRDLGFPGTGGVLVRELPSDQPSPAALAGIQQNDIITAIDGRALANGLELQALIATKRPGTIIQVEVWRAQASGAQQGDAQRTAPGEPMRFPVTLGQLD